MVSELAFHDNRHIPYPILMGIKSTVEYMTLMSFKEKPNG